jgi:fatty acid desaturase
MLLKRHIFAHSRWDAVMVAVSLTEIALLTYGTLSWGTVPGLVSLLVGGLCTVLNCMNYQCIAHSFIHHPFFTSTRANQFFSVVSTLALLAPQTLYRVHHLEHHRFNNDRPDPETRQTRDGSSTYRYSRQPGREENILVYAFWGPLRVDYGYLYRRAKRNGDAFAIWIETAAIGGYMSLLALLNGRGLFFFYLPCLYFGQAFALAHNYAEHHGAQPGNRLTDSVSCYGRLYNLLWFNEGYHQEHHFRPQVHWTKTPQLRAQMLPETERRVVPFIHWVNFVGSSPSTLERRPAPSEAA